jgi:hypothetical protein
MTQKQNHQGEVTLRPKQLTDLGLMLTNKRWGLRHDPGVGKTPPVCVYLSHLANRLGEKAIWTMPKSLLGKNVDELLRFSDLVPEDVYRVGQSGIFNNPLAAYVARLIFSPMEVADTKAKKAFAALHAMGHVDDPENPTTVTSSGVQFLRDNPPCSDFLKAKVILCTFSRFSEDCFVFKAFHPEINAVAVDEWHLAFPTHKSARTQKLYAFMRKCERLIPMTGTAIKGRLTSVYPMIHLFDPNYYFNLKDFENQHELRDYNGRRIGWQNHERIGQILARHTNRRTFEEEYGPEAKVLIVEKVEMAEAQREAYDKFEVESVLELENSFLDGSLPGVATIRCRQIMAHPETFGIMKGDTGKDERLRLHIQDHVSSGEPFVVFAVLIPEQERILRILQEYGLRVALMNGSTSDDNDQTDRDFRHGALDALVVSPKTAGIGFNWEHVDHCIFASLDYGDDSFYQAYRRFIRGKRSKPLLITVLEYKNSIDQRIFYIVEQKSKDAKAVDPTSNLVKLN